MASSPSHTASPRLTQFAKNAGWNMATVLVNLVAGLLISPYMISKLGAEGFGIWSLIFSVIGYYALLDFGFRSAVINFTAQAAALKQYEKINEVMSTAIAISGSMTVLLLVVVLPLAPRTPGWLGISEQYAGIFPRLFILTSTGTILSFAFNIVGGCLEGFQQYGAMRKLFAVVIGVRTLLYFLVLNQGGGLIALILSNWVYWIAIWVGTSVLLWRVFPQLKIHWKFIKLQTLKEMARYGFHTSVNGVAVLGQQTPPVFISRALPDASVGYFSLPERIVQVPLGMIRTVAEMLNPLAAEFTAQNRHGELGRIVTLGNRYGFLMYAPIALVLLTWGTPVIRLWVGDEYARNVGPLLPYFALATWIALAGQGASPGILFGIRAHRWVAWGAAAEAIVVTGASMLVVNQGLVVLAQWVCAAMVVNRCLLLAWATCRELNVSFGAYLWSIYGIPMTLAIPVYYVLEQLSVAWPDKNWWLVFSAASIASTLYLLPAFFTCLDRQHRNIALSLLRRVLRLQPVA